MRPSVVSLAAAAPPLEHLLIIVLTLQQFWHFLLLGVVENLKVGFQWYHLESMIAVTFASRP